MLIDLHVHSRYSCNGVLDPDDIILRARTVGLDGVCFTEDRPLAEWREIKKIATDHQFVALVGLEVLTTQGHYLAFLPQPEMVEPGRVFPAWDAEHLLPIEEVLSRTQDAGGVLVAAHPYDLRVRPPSGDRIFQLKQKGLKGIEARNGKRSSLINDFALEAAENLKLAVTSGSDTRESLDNLGRYATLLRQTVTTEAELVAALVPGESWSVEINSNPEHFVRRTYAAPEEREQRDRRRRF